MSPADTALAIKPIADSRLEQTPRYQPYSCSRYSLCQAFGLSVSVAASVAACVLHQPYLGLSVAAATLTYVSGAVFEKRQVRQMFEQLEENIEKVYQQHKKIEEGLKKQIVQLRLRNEDLAGIIALNGNQPFFFYHTK